MPLTEFWWSAVHTRKCCEKHQF